MGNGNANEYRENQELRLRGNKTFMLRRKLFERWIAGIEYQEYHGVWIARNDQSEGVVLKVIQYLCLRREEWTDDAVEKFDGGTVGAARSEIPKARILHDRFGAGAFDARIITSAQSAEQRYPGAPIDHLIFTPTTNTCNFDRFTTLAAKKDELRNGLADDDNDQLVPVNDVSKALVHLLRGAWYRGFEYRGSYEWILYEEERKSCYIVDPAELHARYVPDKEGDTFDMTDALILVNVR